MIRSKSGEIIITITPDVAIGADVESLGGALTKAVRRVRNLTWPGVGVGFPGRRRHANMRAVGILRCTLDLSKAHVCGEQTGQTKAGQGGPDFQLGRVRQPQRHSLALAEHRRGCARRRWRKKRWGATRRNGERQQAPTHDVTQLEAVLAGCMVKRSTPKQRRSRPLCADAGYLGKNALGTITAYG